MSDIFRSDVYFSSYVRVKLELLVEISIDLHVKGRLLFCYFNRKRREEILVELSHLKFNENPFRDFPSCLMGKVSRTVSLIDDSAAILRIHLK